MIGIVNYGVGNLASILNMLKRLAVPACIVNSPAEMDLATKLILPGVGSFDAGMTSLNESGLLPRLTARVQEEKVPVLGICLGMQMLSEQSEEGVGPGLGWIPGRTVKFQFGDNPAKLKIPHMGWNIAIPNPEAKLFKDCGVDPRYYFVHSYHVVCQDPAHVAASVNYGMLATAAVESGNVYGVQFHPEKSHKFGMKILENFSKV